MEEGADKKVAANRKRSRPEWSQNQAQKEADDDNAPAECLQTPHTLRLLKLIQEGTLEHARIAASHLASLDASPIVLWDLLGRLQAFLCSPQWSTRLHASLAMQGVAQHIPPTDTCEFLQATYSGPLWLTVDQVSKELDTILTEGRVLLSECDTKQDDSLFASQEDRLKRLDDNNRQEIQQDFVEQRVRLQREILAQRLGLGGVVQAVGGTVLADVITQEDLLMNDTNDKSKDKPRKQVKRQRRVENEDDGGSSIRALLVMEMQQQQDSATGSTSHKNPQTLLATELIYRMFDPSWHVRHGAFLGTLSLLRAWNGVAGQNSFGMFPHDVLARCLCVLSLDRFGDYAGAGVGEDGGGGGDSVVAPVREMAGQLQSVLWAMAPESVQTDCLKVLVRLSTRDEWEIRHGALLALKYIAVMLSSDVLERTTCESFDVVIKDISLIAQERLSDEMDDVQSVAAQILFCILSSTPTGGSRGKELIQATCPSLWNVIGRLRGISSCADDFVNLFSAMIRFDVSRVVTSLEPSLGNAHDVLIAIADKLVGFLDYESMAVKLSALEAIRTLAQPFSANVQHQKNQNVRNMLISSYCSLLERLFLTYTVGRYAAAPHEEDKESQTRYENFWSVRDLAWRALVDSFSSVALESPSHRNSLLVRLVLGYVKVECGVATAGQMVGARALNSGATDALALLLRKLENPGDETRCTLNSFLETTFSLLLNSPWQEHCERTCIMYQALNSLGNPVLRCPHELLQKLLQASVPCLLPKLDGLPSGTLSNPKCIERAERILESSLVSVLADESDQRSLEPERYWLTVLRSEGFDFPATTEKGTELAVVNTPSMRIQSLIAGAIVSAGHEHLPPRLTPLVRALMTSLKSERDAERQGLTCASLALLLKVLSCSDDDTRKRVRNKVIENVCAMLSLNASSPEIQSHAAEQVIVLLVSQLPTSNTLEEIEPVWTRLRLLAEYHPSTVDDDSLAESLRLLSVICKGLERGRSATRHVIESMMGPLVPIACSYKSAGTRGIALSIIVSLCQADTVLAMDTSLPLVLNMMNDKESDSRRLGSLRLLQSIIEGVGTSICPFVRCLLPVTMSLMTDSVEDCAKQAAQSFASLVRVSPLVKQTERRHWEEEALDNQSEKVIDHLIHGKPLPPCALSAPILAELDTAGVSLRDYQMEGVTWLRFLQQVKLNGILADDMGTGKSIQALLSIALSHEVAVRVDESARPVSLVVCPSTLIGHWLAEIRKFFPSETVLRGTADIAALGGRSKRAASKDCNVVVISYSVLRREVKVMSKLEWHYCILDEGHLLKNPKTATAVSVRQLRAQHKLILTGTPVQNRVHELWAAFDFLMPNFLGSQLWFSRNFARPISNGQLQGATAESISTGMEKLKLLHQQVLPFILRREKDQVMKELPPKCIIDIPCTLTEAQQDLYETFCQGSDARRAVAALRSSIGTTRNGKEEPSAGGLGGEALKALLYLRLLCTHPSLVEDIPGRANGAKENDENLDGAFVRFDSSGKLSALNDLLRSARVCGEELTAADNDTSALYTDFDDDKVKVDDASALLASSGDVGDALGTNGDADVAKGSKCLIFAQFTQSLDVVERLLFQTQMPSLRYLRLDGAVPPNKRGDLVEAFNRDDSIKVMLLTSRVGSLGLNLTGASTVIFLEHDYNPHADLQAMDRAHRIGQTKTVNVYRLVTQNTVEEKIMKLQETKMAMSKAIVNSENSTMYSMGTDRLLDIFTFRSNDSSHRKGKASKASSTGHAVNLDALEEAYNEDDYASLSVNSFIDGFRRDFPTSEAIDGDTK